jgi:tetratricopeptide (TPR) repeat protein
MFVGFITVALVDAMLFLLIRLVDTQWKERGENVPVSYAAGLFCLCCVAHFGATKTLGRVVMDETQARVAVAVSAALGFAPIWAYVHMLCSRVREEASKQRGEPYPRAKKLRLEGNLEGALRAYLKYYEQDPRSPRPLFSAAGMLEMANDYKKAAILFRQIMERFEKDTATWGRAAYRLARLRAERLNDAAGAAELRAQIERRIPAQERGQLDSLDLGPGHD